MTSLWHETQIPIMKKLVRLYIYMHYTYIYLDFLKCILRDSIRHPRLAVKIAHTVQIHACSQE